MYIYIYILESSRALDSHVAHDTGHYHTTIQHVQTRWISSLTHARAIKLANSSKTGKSELLRRAQSQT